MAGRPSLFVRAAAAAYHGTLLSFGPSTLPSLYLATSSLSRTASTSAAEVRTLSVSGVAAFVQSLGVDVADASKLVAQKIDGAALFEMTVGELLSYGILGGSAHAIVRAIAPAVKAVADAQEAVADTASAITLKVYHPLKKGGGPKNSVKVTLTPDDFYHKYTLSGVSLQLVSKDGTVLEELVALKQAVEASRHPTATLRTTRPFNDVLGDLRLRGCFVENVAEELEQVMTRALANDTSLALEFGPLEGVNSAETLHGVAP